MKNLWDSPVMQLLQQTADLILLNVVWLVCSLPIVTIGPASAAMYETLKPIQAGGGTRVIPVFREAFTRRFPHRMLAGWAVLLCESVLAVDFLALAQFDGAARPVLFGLFLFLSVLVLVTASCLFPLMAEYNIGAGRGIRLAFWLSFRRIGRAGAAALLHALPLLLFLFMPPVFLLLIPLWLTGYFSLAASLSSRLLRPVLQEGGLLL